MNDAEYIAAIAEFYKDGPSPEFRAHYERLTHISGALAAAPSQPRDDAVFVVWWSDHMPNSTEADAWAEWCALRSNQPTAQAQDVDLWYLQDTRSYVGNDVVWWAKDGKGYTTDVSKAHVYGREEAFRQAAMRGTDRAWPKAYIDGKTRPAVDMQYIDHAAAIAAQKGGTNAS